MDKLLQKFPDIENSDELFDTFKVFYSDVVARMIETHDPDRVDYYIRDAAEMALEDNSLPDPYTSIDEEE